MRDLSSLTPPAGRGLAPAAGEDTRRPTASLPAAYPLRFDHELVERAVLARTRDLSGRRRAAFHEERDAIYECADPDGREARFRSLHSRWFQEMDLAVPVQRALAERPAVVGNTAGCSVFRSPRRKDEHADLLVAAGASSRRPMLVVRLRPETLLDAPGLLRFLRHELLHVGDMLDSEFGYRRALPASDLGPAFDNLVRDRYRVLWDTTIDGRLHGEGRLTEPDRARRRVEFDRTFRMLGDRRQEEFRRWFEGPRPAHSQLAAFARTPGGTPGPGAQAGCCPICRLPSALLSHRPERPSPEAIRRIQGTHPVWEPAHGICPQCADLYEAMGSVLRLSAEPEPAAVAHQHGSDDAPRPSTVVRAPPDESGQGSR